MDCQSTYSFYQQDKQVLKGCLCSQDVQVAVQKHRVSKIVSSVEWRAVQAEKMCSIVL